MPFQLLAAAAGQAVIAAEVHVWRSAASATFSTEPYSFQGCALQENLLRGMWCVCAVSAACSWSSAGGRCLCCAHVEDSRLCNLPGGFLQLETAHKVSPMRHCLQKRHLRSCCLCLPQLTGPLLLISASPYSMPCWVSFLCMCKLAEMTAVIASAALSHYVQLAGWNPHLCEM